MKNITNEQLKELALKYVDSKLSVLPTRPDKLPDKAVCPTQKHLHDAPPTLEEVDSWFDNGHQVEGLGLFGGRGVTIIDFDDMEFYERWNAVAGTMAAVLPLQKSGKGMHVAFRSDLDLPTSKLARIPDTSAKSGYRVGIETRCYGSYIMLAPSKYGDTGKRYIAVTGNFYDLPRIDTDHANALIQIAKSLDQYTPPVKQSAYKSNCTDYVNESVAAFNKKFTVQDILKRNNYDQSPTDQSKWRHPDSTSGSYGLTIFDNDICFSFNTNDPLCTEDENGLQLNHKHDAFDTMKILEHGPNWKDHWISAINAAEDACGIEPFKVTKENKNKASTYRKALTRLRYHFHLNTLDDSVEVNGVTMEDTPLAEIRHRMRDIGILGGVEDAIVAFSQGKSIQSREGLSGIIRI
ncbi:MAG: bifunctional DNA primase/polymerase [Candidatus Electryonea clarkiae]|nr:bifunctional DNA primase/polymerase [Candidatus Electryonea clarkiae]MDP8285954.1 bifunctional DNA primase/polymerase [Candidatus Electryonea clarkiae]